MNSTRRKGEDTPLLEENSGVPLSELIRNGGAGILHLLTAVLGNGIKNHGAVAKKVVSAVLPGDDTGYAFGVRGVGGESIFCLLKVAIIGTVGNWASVARCGQVERGTCKEYDLPGRDG